MKFGGGTSVGNPGSLQLVKNIIENQKEPVIVVVSALNGVTDRLLLAADFALNNNSGYKSLLDEMVDRHKEIIEKNGKYPPDWQGGGKTKDTAVV